MAGEMLPFPLEKDELERKREKTDIQRTINVDELNLADIKDATLENTHCFTEEVQSVIMDCVAKGIAISTASLFAGVAPATTYKWLRAGKLELEAITEEQITAETNVADLLSDKGRFFLALNQAKATGIVLIHTSLYERAFEAGKEFVAMYLLERADPDTYNLKRKVENDTKAEEGDKTNITFTFVNGKTQRSPEDLAIIENNLQELKELWGDGEEVKVKEISEDMIKKIEFMNQDDEGEEE